MSCGIRFSRVPGGETIECVGLSDAETNVALVTAHNRRKPHQSLGAGAVAASAVQREEDQVNGQ